MLAIELDVQFDNYLKTKFSESNALEVIHGDVLQVNLEELMGARSGERIAVTGNLPYYITSPIIRRIFQVHERISAALLLVQKEVADRIVAAKGTRDYAYLSVLCQLYADSKLLFQIPASAFQPPPKVTSALIQLEMRSRVRSDAEFLKFLQLCFRQRRKMLRNNLSGAFDRTALVALEITRRRAQQLEIEELRQLWDELRPAQRPSSAKLLDRP